MEEWQSEDHGQKRDCLCRCFFCVEAWRELFRMICFVFFSWTFVEGAHLADLVYFTLRFLSLVDLHLLPVYIIICFCSHYPIMKSLYFMFEFYGHFLLLQKWQKSHLITAATLPLHVVFENCILSWEVSLFQQKNSLLSGNWGSNMYFLYWNLCHKYYCF